MRSTDRSKKAHDRMIQEVIRSTITLETIGLCKGCEVKKNGIVEKNIEKL